MIKRSQAKQESSLLDYLDSLIGLGLVGFRASRRPFKEAAAGAQVCHGAQPKTVLSSRALTRFWETLNS